MFIGTSDTEIGNKNESRIPHDQVKPEWKNAFTLAIHPAQSWLGHSKFEWPSQHCKSCLRQDWSRLKCVHICCLSWPSHVYVLLSESPFSHRCECSLRLWMSRYLLTSCCLFSILCIHICQSVGFRHQGTSWVKGGGNILIKIDPTLPKKSWK